MQRWATPAITKGNLDRRLGLLRKNSAGQYAWPSCSSSLSVHLYSSAIWELLQLIILLVIYRLISPSKYKTMPQMTQSSQPMSSSFINLRLRCKFILCLKMSLTMFITSANSLRLSSLILSKFRWLRWRIHQTPSGTPLRTPKNNLSN